MAKKQTNGGNGLDHRRGEVQAAIDRACDQLNSDGVSPRDYVEQLAWLFYLKAFDEMEKEALVSSVGRGLAAIGRGVTGAVRGAGKAVAKGAAEGSARSTLGGAMQRGAKGVFDAGGDAQALLGGAVLGTGLAAGGAGLMAGRYVVPKQRQQR